MAEILVVNACVRGEESRTERLMRAFVEALCAQLPGARVTVQDLPSMGLQPVDRETLSRKERLCDAFAWDDPYLAPAAAFQHADAVVIAAPYWDMSFPAILKIWVENMYVRNLTFRYVDDKPVGLCRGQEAVYITTAGSPVGENDWGTGYIRAVMSMLGILHFSAIKAEALDMAGSDVEAIVAAAEKRAVEAAKELACKLKG